MRPFFKISRLLPVLFFLMGTLVLAQKKPVVPAHHRELLSGGSIEIEDRSRFPSTRPFKPYSN